MDDPLLMGVLDGVADRDEEVEPLFGVSFLLVAILRDRHALDLLHDEEGPAASVVAGVEDLGDVGVVHHGQGLPFRLEAGKDAESMPGLMSLRATMPPDRLRLLGHPDDAHAPFADRLEQL